MIWIMLTVIIFIFIIITAYIMMKDPLYAVTMTDPDAPSANNPVNKDWLHWMAVDIPASSDIDYSTHSIMNGKTILEYTPPAPPPGSGPHRYITRLWEQKSPMGSFIPPQRAKFNTSDFASKHSWTLLQESQFIQKG